MDFKHIAITNVLLSTMVGSSVWAHEPTVVKDGDWSGRGLKTEGNLSATINTNGNINTSNHLIGTYLSDHAPVTFKNIALEKTVLENNNGEHGIFVTSDDNRTIEGKDVIANGNAKDGIRADKGGTVKIIGTNDNKLEIADNNSADKNMGNGIIADGVSNDHKQSSVIIENMDITIKDHAYQGLAARAGGIINIISDTGKDFLEVYSTRMADMNGQDAGKGIHAKETDGASGKHSVIAITDMNIISNDNELEGLVSADSGVIFIESSSGSNTLTANENRQYTDSSREAWSYGAGILAHGVSANSPGQQAAVVIENMNVETRDNGLYGLYVRDGGVISITGDGSHTLDITGNKSTVSHTWDAGIAIEGLIAGATSPTPAAIDIKNMQVTIEDNGRYGIDIASGGQMTISSTEGNSLTVSGNKTDNSQKNEGMGIHVTGVFDDTRSQLDIVDMNIAIDGSPDAGLQVADGALVNIGSTTGKHMLLANGNDNQGTQYNEGAGLFAFDSETSQNPSATLNIVGMDIEAKNNGSYGVLSEGAHINIVGQGSHKLDVDGNGRYGLLAKDGGSMSVTGMNVSGNSQEHSLVGIERSGRIHFIGSTIATDNDALFYTWSDSDTQKSEYVLNNSIAVGKGQVLANFNAHNSTLTATHSALVNAIVTNTEASATSTVSLDHSTWQMKNNSLLTHLNAKASLIDLRGDSDHNTLTITGNYLGENSTLVMNTQLGDDDSLTDKLIVEGNTSGTTNVVVKNAGGSGAKTLNGIEIIEVNGRSDGEFVQSGRIVAGSYDYFLGRGNGDKNTNWYLTNTQPEGPENPTDPSVPVDPAKPANFRPEVGSYLANQIAANTLFSMRLHDRIGDTQYTDLLTGEQKVTSLWLRQVGGHNRYHTANGQLHTQSNRYVAQLGGDIAQWSDDGQDRWHLGLMAGYGNSQSNTDSNVNGYRSRGHVTGYSVGVYGTWYANEEDKTGTYLDTWALYNWFKNTVSGQGLASEKYDAKGITASVEAGYSFLLGESESGRSSYWLQPKAQLTWMGVKSDDHTEANGTQVKTKRDGNLQTRVGIRTYIKGHNIIDEGKNRDFQPFVEANWIANPRSYGVTMNGVTSYQQGARNLGELKVGVEGQLNKNLQLWGNVAQQVGDKGYSDTQGMLGIKYGF